MEASPFLFGKLPAHGDFVARGLSDADREGWDDWGAAALAALRQSAGDDFEAAHSAAAPWRFVTREGDLWSAGALAPSIDGVGRRFLVALGLSGLSGPLAGALGVAVAEAAEGLIYDALAQGFAADFAVEQAGTRFAEVLEAQGAARVLAATPQGDGVWWTLGSEAAGPMALASGRAPSDLLVRGAASAIDHPMDLLRVS